MDDRDGSSSHNDQVKSSSERIARVTKFIPLIVAGSLAAGVMFFFPPWEFTTSRPGAAVATRPAGYACILTPPEPQSPSASYGVRIDGLRLGIQFGALLCLLALGAVALALSRPGRVQAMFANAGRSVLALLGEGFLVPALCFCPMFLGLFGALLLKKLGIVDPHVRGESSSFAVVLVLIGLGIAGTFAMHILVAPRLERWFQNFGRWR
ncbi:MAG: hypothetical protein JNK02_01715 [Planctomycetes bacterium]|nr:hypothetical protein [Planctomycetota bacterium]